MQSALSPREIQTRLRAGESVADLAAEAGVDEGYVDNFAGPILAERENAVRLARGAQVRRRGEASSNRKLADAVLDKLATLGVDEDAVSWDAYREPEKNWTIAVSWPNDSLSQAGAEQGQIALFDFDHRGRFSVAKDAAARILLDDQHSAPQQRPDPDAEPTIDLNDELALVRAVQGTDPRRPAVVADELNFENFNDDTESIGRIVNVAATEHTDWSEPDLEQVDGIYEIAKGGNMDVLYEMLAGFNEDSVRIYTGLTKPPVEPQQATVTTQAVVRTTVQLPSESGRGDADLVTVSAATEDAQPSEPAREKPAQKPADEQPVREHSADQAAFDPAEQAPAVDEPTQDSLIGDPAPQPAKTKSSKSRKRASVPSWDEIMFGSPHTS